MTYSLINKCAKNYYNRTFVVPVIAKNVVTCFFLRHSVVSFITYQIKVVTKQYMSISLGFEQQNISKIILVSKFSP